MKKIILTAAFVLVSIATSAQYNYRDSNRIGITVGINQFDLLTKNFPTKAGIGWNTGLSLRGSFYNDFDMVYAMQFSENEFSVPTTNVQLKKEDVEYKLRSAQISLMLSYQIVENNLSVEIGPMIQINDKLNIDENENKTNIIDETTLAANDITRISRFNFYPSVGITAGIKHFRANLQYQYGVTNMLGNLNDYQLGQHFKGHASILSANLIMYL